MTEAERSAYISMRESARLSQEWLIKARAREKSTADELKEWDDAQFQNNEPDNYIADGSLPWSDGAGYE